MYTTEAPDGTTLRYATAGPADGEPVALVGEAGLGPWQWGWQHGALGPFRTLAVDLRGTGAGPDAPPDPYDVGTLAADLEAVLADAGVRRVHFLGFGLGGMVCLRYARKYGRARSLALVGTASSGDAVDRESFAALFAAPDALSGAFTLPSLAAGSSADPCGCACAGPEHTAMASISRANSPSNGERASGPLAADGQPRTDA